MTCEERRDLLLLMATGALDPEEERELRQHLSTGCVQCAGALAEAEALIHKIPQSLPPLRVPETAWESIESRIALREQMEMPQRTDLYALAQPVAQPRAPNSKIMWFGWAVAAGLAIAIGWPLFDASRQIEDQQLELNRLRDASSAAKALNERVDVLTRQINVLREDRKNNEAQLKEKQDQLEGLLRSAIYAVGGPGNGIEQPEVTGQLFWDKTQHRWTLFASHVKALPPGKTYELWIITADGRKIGAVIGQPDANDNLIMEAQLPADPGTLATAAVTDEPEFVRVPTGKIQFLGSVTKQ